MFANKWDFKHCTSSLGHSQANGKTEAAVKDAKRMLKRAAKSGQDPYMAMLDMRNTPTQGLQHSPAQRLMSRRTRAFLPTRSSLLQQEVVNPGKVRALAEKKQVVQQKYFNKGAKVLPTLDEGDVVRVKPFVLGQKEWSKGIVQQRLDERSYIVETPERTYRRNRVHLKSSRESPDTPSISTESSEALVVGSGDGDAPEVQSAMAGPDPATGDQTPSAQPNEYTTMSGRIVKRPVRFQ